MPRQPQPAVSTLSTLRSVVGAIRRSEAIEVKYQSLSARNPAGAGSRRMPSRSTASAGTPRAFCFGDEVFKDFLLSRIIDIRGSRESGILADEDHDWNAIVTLEIGPHPALSDTQAKVIALDYGMKGDKAEIRVRRALLYYALRRLGLDTDPAARQPHDQQIVLLNREGMHEIHG